jgi:hypothetical protein
VSLCRFHSSVTAPDSLGPEGVRGQAGQGRREAGKGSAHQCVTRRRPTEDAEMYRAHARPQRPLHPRQGDQAKEEGSSRCQVFLTSGGDVIARRKRGESEVELEVKEEALSAADMTMQSAYSNFAASTATGFGSVSQARSQLAERASSRSEPPRSFCRNLILQERSGGEARLCLILSAPPGKPCGASVTDWFLAKRSKAQPFMAKAKHVLAAKTKPGGVLGSVNRSAIHAPEEGTRRSIAAARTAPGSARRTQAPSRPHPRLQAQQEEALGAHQ